jgi:predicted PurR-regulated permease PerM
MPGPDETLRPDPHGRTLWLLLGAVTLALGWILVPFYGPLLWATIIAQLFRPLRRRMQRRLPGRPTVVALLTLMTAVVMVIVPFTLISALLAREAMGVYSQLQSGAWNPTLELRRLFDALPTPLRSVLDSMGLANFASLQTRLGAGLTQASQFLATRALGLGQNTFEFVADLFITTYVAFFLIRDGDALVDLLRRALPLSPAHTNELLDKFATVVRATVKGNLLVAALQGLLGGLAFWMLGLSAALLWGVLMAFLSLLPAVGAALVWAPVVLYLWVTGAVWQGLGLLAWGVLVIGLVDNLLRPLLVGRDTRMPDWVIMVTTLGGMAVFGLNGFVIGPTIAAMFIAVWHLHGLARAAR